MLIVKILYGENLSNINHRQLHTACGGISQNSAAIPLLVSSDKKTYEIAVEVGFTDARTFTEAFQRYYHETPNLYRKRIKGETH